MMKYATFLLVFEICVGFWTRGELLATESQDKTHESETRASKFGTLARAVYSLGIDNSKFKNGFGSYLCKIGVGDWNNTSFILQNSGQKIEGCLTGVRSDKTVTTIVNNVVFDEVLTGIHLSGNYASSSFVAGGNKISMKSSGILAISPGQYRISSNQIYHKYTPNQGISVTPDVFGGFGVGIFGSSQVFGNDGWISNNKIFVKTNSNPNLQSAICAGIVVMNGNWANISANEIKLQNNIPTTDGNSRFYGIYKQNGFGHKVCGNEITGLNGYDRGIGSIMSPGTTTCNKMRYTREGLYFEADNTLDDGISSNEIADSYTGVHVNSTTAMPAGLGNQNFTGNTWINNWGFGGRWIGGDYTFMDESIFRSNPTQTDYYPTSQIEPAAGWFEKDYDFDNQSDCPNSAGLSATCSQRRPLNEEEQVLMGMAAHSELLEEPYRSMVLRKSYGILMDLYPSGEYPENVSTFMDLYEEKIWAKLAEIDFMLEHPLVEEPELANQIHELQDSLITMMPAYNAYQMSLGNLSYQDLMTALSQTPPSIKTQFTNVTVTLTTLHQQANSIIAQKLALANYLNQNLQPDNDYTALEKQLNAVYISHQMADTLEYSASDIAAIKEIAFYCPQDKGDVVYKARGLYIQLGGAIDKNWDDCTPNMNSNSAENRNQQFENPKVGTATEQPKIFPVPTSDWVNLFVPDAYIGAKYRLMNQLGIVVSTGFLQSQLQNLDFTEFKNGFYFLDIRGNNSNQVTLKVIIQK
jgi:hypothetical protein